MTHVPQPNQGEQMLTEKTGLVVETWYRFFARLYTDSGGGTGVERLIGDGTPEGAVTANPGSTFQRRDGGAGTSFYVKESGSGDTGWVGK